MTDDYTAELKAANEAAKALTAKAQGYLWEGSEEMEPTCLECGRWSPGWRTCEECRPAGWNLPLTA
jgi:hypothetical protein